MGSILQGSNWEIKKREAFTKVFSRLNQKVLWKYENESLPDKPENVMITKWLPQRDVLAHPNVKLFISHGGLLGISESIASGVPMIGIPIYADQTMNILKAVDDGYGILMNYDDIEETLIRSNIQEILSNPKYRNNAKEVSMRFNDRPMTPQKTTSYWVEYVIRYKGAPQFKSAAHNLNFIQRNSIDSYAFLTVIIGSIFYLLFKLKCAIFNAKNEHHQGKLKRH